MLDSSRRVTGAADYDIFGLPNRVSLDKETAHPYANNTNIILADFIQPLGGTANPSTQVRMRAIFDVVDTEGPTGNPADYFYLKDPDGGAALTGHLGGPHVGQLSTAWVIPSAGRVQVPFLSNATGNTYTGVAMSGYEYQRFQTGAQPFWTPLALPGQYRDAETDLLQNWNRFYDANIGRYYTPEPELNDSTYSVTMAKKASQSVPAYSYALNGPLVHADPTGLDVFRIGAGELHQSLGVEFECSNTCDPDPWIFTISFGCANFFDPACVLGNGGYYIETGKVKLSDIKGTKIERCETDCETTQNALQRALSQCGLGYNVFWNNCQSIVSTAMNAAGCN
jgi:RHS repeat-associated protein